MVWPDTPERYGRAELGENLSLDERRRLRRVAFAWVVALVALAGVAYTFIVFVYLGITWLSPTLPLYYRTITIILGAAAGIGLLFWIRRQPNLRLWGAIEVAIGMGGVAIAAYLELRSIEQWLGLLGNMVVCVEGLHRFNQGRHRAKPLRQ